MPEETVTVLRAKGVLDVDLGEVLEGASVVVEGNTITAVTDDPTATSGADQVIDLPDLTLVPGLMDMEVDLVLGGPNAGLSDPVRLDPVKMGLRAVANGQRTLAAGFTTVRNLGLFIKTGGYKVGAGEVESCLLEHPSVSEVAVVGVPDPEWGERIVAFVVLRRDTLATAEELIERVAGQLAPHKRPREVRFVTDLPRNAMGKVQKHRLRPA